MPHRFNDKVAVVVGATDAVGAATARRLAEHRAKVALLDADGDRLSRLAAEISRAGGSALAVTADPRRSETARRAVEQIRQELGPIDVLVNNSPDPEPHGVGAVTAEGFSDAIARTVGAQIVFMRNVVPQMQERQRGRVVNLISLDYLGLPGGADRAAVQSATIGLTRSVALEAARQGVTVNTVVKGDLTRPGLSEEEAMRAVAHIPARRLGTADDVAYAVCFFASDTSNYVTGQTFFVCGGRSAYFSMSV